MQDDTETPAPNGPRSDGSGATPAPATDEKTYWLDPHNDAHGDSFLDIIPHDDFSDAFSDGSVSPFGDTPFSDIR